MTVFAPLLAAAAAKLSAHTLVLEGEVAIYQRSRSSSSAAIGSQSSAIHQQSDVGRGSFPWYDRPGWCAFERVNHVGASEMWTAQVI